MDSPNFSTETTGYRKIVQIAVAGTGDGDSRLYALDSDGKLWELNYRLPGSWGVVPPLPSKAPRQGD